MIGDIIGIDENIVTVKLNIKIEEVQSLINFYVIMDDGDRKIIGEIIDISDGNAYINLAGEMIDNRFVAGVNRKPSFVHP